MLDPIINALEIARTWIEASTSEEEDDAREARRRVEAALTARRTELRRNGRISETEGGG